MKNGKLSDAAEALGFDALITVDQHIPAQQNLIGRRISILVLCAPTNRLSDLDRLIASVRTVLASIEKGKVIRVGARA